MFFCSVQQWIDFNKRVDHFPDECGGWNVVSLADFFNGDLLAWSELGGDGCVRAADVFGLWRSVIVFDVGFNAGLLEVRHKIHLCNFKKGIIVIADNFCLNHAARCFMPASRSRTVTLPPVASEILMALVMLMPLPLRYLEMTAGFMPCDSAQGVGLKSLSIKYFSSLSMRHNCITGIICQVKFH